MPQGKDIAKIRREQAEAALDEAYAMREQYTEYVARRKANREELRNLAAQGHLSDEQLGEVEDLYPKRQAKEQEEEEQAAEQAAA